MEVDRAQAAKFGADVSAVGDIVKLVTNGIKLGDYRPDDADEEIDIRVRYPVRQYRSLDQLDQLKIKTEAGQRADRQLRHAQARAEGGKHRCAPTAAAR